MMRLLIRAGPLSVFAVLALPLTPARAADNAAPASTSKVVAITLPVPANAEVWFNKDKTTQTGASRQFVSPPLSPGHDITVTSSACAGRRASGRSSEPVA